MGGDLDEARFEQGRLPFGEAVHVDLSRQRVVAEVHPGEQAHAGGGEDARSGAQADAVALEVELAQGVPSRALGERGRASISQRVVRQVQAHQSAGARRARDRRGTRQAEPVVLELQLLDDGQCVEGAPQRRVIPDAL